MKTKIYLDTTIVSALFDKRTPSIKDDVHHLANMYIKNENFPKKYLDDALHTAITSTNNIGILLSWNFTHLVKIRTRRMVALINAVNNYNPVEIISPPEL